MESNTLIPPVYLDWYSAEQLRQLIKSGIQAPTADPVCGGMYWEPPRDFLSPQVRSNPGSLTGSATEYQYEKNAFATLEGDVVLQQNQMQVESDRVNINFTTDHAALSGNIRFRDNGFLMVGDTAEFDLNTGSAGFYNASYVVHANHIRGKAKRIQSDQNGTLAIRRGSYTGCEPGNNAWQFYGRKILLDRESGWGTANDMILKIKGVPIAYAPYFRFPIDDRRHSGFLYPQFDSLSDPDISIPYYWSIAPHMDATFTPRRIGGRGTLWQTEFRYLSTFGEGMLTAARLPQDREFNDQNRDGAGWEHDYYWGDMFNVKLDAGYVSDNDYREDFGYDLNSVSSSHLHRRINANYFSEHWRLNALVQAYQTIDDDIVETNFPYRKLPEINAYHQSLSNRIPHVAETAWAWNNHFQYVYFAQPLATANRYVHRVHSHTQLGLPLQWIWGYVKPSASLQLTHYEPHGDDETAEESFRRAVPSFSLDSGLFFDRPYSIGKQQFLNTLEPRIYYLYTPFRDQDSLPLIDSTELTFNMDQLSRNNRFSGIDRIGDTNQLSIGVTSRLIHAENGEPFAMARIGQLFYADDREVQLNRATEPDRNSSSPIIGDAEIHWNRFMNTQLSIEWDPYAGKIDQGMIQFQWIAAAQHLLNLGYRYSRAATSEDEIDQANFSYLQQITHRWQVIAVLNADIEQKNILEQLTGFEYDSCCWRAGLIYRRRIEESDLNTDPSNRYSILMQIELKGLAALGGKIDKLLAQYVPGFERF